MFNVFGLPITLITWISRLTRFLNKFHNLVRYTIRSTFGLYIFSTSFNNASGLGTSICFSVTLSRFNLGHLQKIQQSDIPLQNHMYACIIDVSRGYLLHSQSCMFSSSRDTEGTWGYKHTVTYYEQYVYASTSVLPINNTL